MFNQQFKDAIKSLITQLGDDPDRADLLKTPQRFFDGMKKLTQGYAINSNEIITGCLDTQYQQLIELEDIAFTSVCEHHLMPFFGKITVSYIPNNKLIGIGSIIKVVEALSKRLQIQERLGSEIALTIHNSMLQPSWVQVKISAQHLCLHASNSSAGMPIMKTSYEVAR